MSVTRKIPRELSVGEVAARSGAAVSAIHFYESEGLISSRRNAANHRRYDRDVLRRIAIIKVAQRAGVPLREIAAAFSTLPEQRVPNRADWEKLSAVWHSDLEARIKSLSDLRDRLSGCIGCGCLSVDKCPLYNPDDKLAKDGAGPRLLL